MSSAGGARAQERDPASEPDRGRERIEEITVTGEQRDRAPLVPRNYVSDVEAGAINVTTVEDFLAYQPSMIVRRRFIGDSNGTVGIRGANMFQTARSLVYADGLPLHYLLQTRWSGAPRWGLISPDEVRGMEVLYGPFSAEYPGNSMGGVINIETDLPTERRIHLEGAGFLQNFQHLGSNERFDGRQVQLSYGDRFGPWSVYVAHHHLANESQPMTFRSAAFDENLNPAATAVQGSRPGRNHEGARVAYVGDTGPGQVTTNLTKLKVGYTFGDWVARFSTAYESRRNDVRDPESYLRADGIPVWGGAVSAGDESFTVNPSGFQVSRRKRQSLLIGTALDGPIAPGWDLEVDLSLFDLMEDDERSRSVIGTDTSRTEYNDTEWMTGSVKLRTRELAGRPELDLVLGYSFDRYTLDIDHTSGGDTQAHGLFAQAGWQLSDRWDVQFGLRLDGWRSLDGFRNADRFSDRRETGLSPNFSIGFAPDDRWQLRYSVARARRFPVVEELFRNSSTLTTAFAGVPTLAPEVGLHHNLMVERTLANGFVRANFFHETIEDAIFNQIGFFGDETAQTFLPITEEVIRGVELVAGLRGLLGGRVDVTANLSYVRARIEQNDLNPSLEGNVFPRMPEWRGNLLLSYHWSPRLESSIGLRFASDSFGSAENIDDVDRVYGAQDAYRFVNLRLNYRLSEQTRVSLGIDNLFGEEAFVAHPWPMRTFYVEFSADL